LFVIIFSSNLAVNMAASLRRFHISAQLNHTVLLARLLKSTSSAIFLFLACTLRIFSLSDRFGSQTVIFLSNLPGLRSALSSTSTLFVAHITITFVSLSKPSISVRIWFSVCSLSSCPQPVPGHLFFPIASISSINMIAGAIFFAFVKRSLTLEAPTHTNISTNSEPEILINGTSLSPATARARSVFHVPGGHTRSVPLGIFAQRSLYFFGFFKKSTTSASSSFSSSDHATSLKVILSLSLSYRRALDFPNVIALFATPHILLMRKSATITKRITIRIVGITSAQNSLLVLSTTEIFVSILGFFSPKSLSESLLGRTMMSLLILSTPFSFTLAHEYMANALFPSILISLYFQATKFCSN
jgi:hypothetical protein